MTVLLVRDGREFLCEPGDELQTDLGVLDVPLDVEPGQTIETHLGEGFRVRRLRCPDLFHHLERTGAPMLPRDIGLLLGHTGIEAGDRVLDAGTGSGVLAAWMGRLDVEVVTYEQNPEFAAVARDNMRMADVADRVDVRTGDVTEVLDDLGGFDALTLDTEDAPRVVARAGDLLAPDGVVGVYSPFVEDARAVADAAAAAPLEGIETYETIQREMDFDERGSRPTPTGVGHTGYLTVGRVE